MHHDVYLGCIDRRQQRGLQQRLNARYNAVTELLLCCHSRCFSALIRGTEQIGSQPLRTMLETRYAGCYDAATCVATYRLLLSVVTPSETR